MRLKENAGIRANIMLIAVLGGLGFLCYLLVNVHLANANRARLNELLEHRYPVIEQVRKLKQDADGIRESLTAAVALEDGFLVEDSVELAVRFRANANELVKMEPAFAADVQALLVSFEGYFDHARTLALLLIETDDNLDELKHQLDETHLAFADVLAGVDSLYRVAREQYSDLLLQTHSAVVDANRLGALLGGLIIVGLVLLAWAISVRVLGLINRSDQAKNAFLATISHELRTPMNGVLGALNLLRSGAVSGQQSALLEAAQTSANAMMTSIDDILIFSEIISGQSAVDGKPVHLGRSLDALLKAFSETARARGLSYHYDVCAALDRVVTTDEPKVLHVVRHLVANGLKFTDAGGVEVQVNLRGERVLVRVVDTGPGIDPADMSQLFRPFGQLDGSFRRRHQGIGIGLAICAAIARLLGGSVKLANRDPHGLEAVFEFPVGLAEASAQVAEHSVPRKTESEVPAVVLVVEDNPVNQLVMKGYLQKLGLQVLTAANGREAVDLVSAQPVQLVLMDCQMPVMDGFEATRCIRQLPAPAGHVPIVAVTANVLDVDRAQCMEAGMNIFLKKPVDLLSVRDAVAAFVPLSVDPLGG